MNVDEQRVAAPGGHLIAAQQGVVAVIRQIHQEQAGLGHPVAREILELRRAAAPNWHCRVAPQLRLRKRADQTLNHVAVHGVVDVAQASQIGRHGRQKLGAILAVVVPAGLNAGEDSDFSHVISRAFKFQLFLGAPTTRARSATAMAPTIASANCACIL